MLGDMRNEPRKTTGQRNGTEPERKQKRKPIIGVIRFAVCGVALWFVVRGVNLHDEVVLKDGGPNVTGIVTIGDGDVFVQTAGGKTEALPLAAVAVDENGAPRITYGLASAWTRCSKPLLLVAVVVFSFVPLLQAFRIQLLLGARAIRLSYRAALKLSYAGNFLNFAAPLGSTAGDVFKAYYLAKHTNRKTEAMTLVFLDRIIGLGTLVLVVSLITILSPADDRLAPLRSYMIVLIAIGATAAVAYLAPPVRRAVRWDSLRARLPMSEQLARIDNTAVSLARSGRILGGALATSVGLQILAAGSFLAVALAVGLVAHAGDLPEYYAYFSTGELVKALPGPPQGLGTMELAYGYFFAPFGSASQILCAAFSIRVVMLVCALPGLLVTVVGAHKPAQSAGQRVAPGMLQPE